MRIADALQTNVAAAVSGLGTTAKIFQYAAAPLVPASVSPGAVTLAIPGSGRLNGKRFEVTASGNATVAGVSPTVQLQLIGTLPGGNPVVLAQSTAQTVTTNASYPWSVTAQLQGDNLSGILQGTFSDIIDNLADAPAHLTNAITSGVNFGTNTASGAANGASYPTSGFLNLNAGDEPVINLTVALVFGVSNAANKGNLFEFYAFEE